MFYIYYGTCGIDGKEKSASKNDFDENSINAVKSSLMGPLAGIGDSIFWGVLRVIAAGIAVGLGASGNILAPLVFLVLFNVPSILIKYYGTFFGYKLGSEYIQKSVCKWSYEYFDKGCKYCWSDYGWWNDSEHGNIQIHI